jgi:hypothetical protein
MKVTAGLLWSLAVILFSGACRSPGSMPPAAAGSTREPRAREAAAPLTPSPRLIVGRVLSIDAAQRLAIIALQSDAPTGALAEGTELIARDYQSLAPTARLRASRYLRGRTLGTAIVSGQASPGDEVVWLAP